MTSLKGEALEKRRKQVEGAATFGLILICVALVSPFTNPDNFGLLSIFRWIYGAGTVIYLIARIADISDPEESVRLKRLRRMEFWAGIAFAIATFFWFYSQYHVQEVLGQNAGILVVMRNTITFTLVGAIIQIIASWLIYSQSKKDLKNRS